MNKPPKNKRILLIRNAMPYDFGGAERFAVDLGSELRELGWESLVVSRSNKLLDYAKQQNVNHRKGWWWQNQNWNGKHALLFPVYLGWQVILCIWYLQLIARFKPDVVHPQSKDDFIAATFAARLLSKRVVWTDHADLKYVFANNTARFKNPVGKLVRRASDYAHHITLVSYSEKKLITDSLGHQPGEQYQVIYNGVTDRKVSPHKRSADSFILCATSRLVRAKGIGEQIAAFKRFVTKHPEAELWLVGDGPDEEMFKEQAGDTPNISFIGHSDTPLEYVAASDVFVHPSYHEGFSISLIEAAMLGKPIIACNVGGNPEIIKDQETGLLIEAQDENSLFQAMERLYDDRKLAAKLGQGARTSFEKSFQFEKIVADEFVPIYEK